MNWFKRNKTITFCHTNEAIGRAYPILNMSDLSMPWADKSKKLLAAKAKTYTYNSNQYATHRCSGIVELMNTGYVLTLPMDVAITTNGDGRSFSWSTPAPAQTILGEELISSFGENECANDIAPPGSLSTIIKFTTGWTVHMPKGWELLIIPLQYTGEKRFTSSAGIMKYRGVNQLNAIVYWHQLNGTTLLKAGTPLCQMIPIKVDTGIKAVVKDMDKTDFSWRGILKTLSLNKFIKRLDVIEKLYDDHMEHSKCPVTRITKRL